MLLYSETNWRKNYGDALSQKKITLQDLLPKVGETLTVEVINFGYEIKAKSSLLWRPSGSEQDGWGYYPSEINSSYLIAGLLSKVSGEIYRCEIKSVTPLIDVLDNTEELSDFTFPSCMEIDGRSSILWEQAESLKTAKVGRYTYLTGVNRETYLETILVENTNSTILVYHSYEPPAVPETVITQYTLSSEEHKLFRRLLKKAEAIIEIDEPYLDTF